MSETRGSGLAIADALNSAINVNAAEDDPTFKLATREVDSIAARDDMQTFVFSATLSKDLQTNLKRGRRPTKKGKKEKGSTLGAYQTARGRSIA